MCVREREKREKRKYLCGQTRHLEKRERARRARKSEKKKRTRRKEKKKKIILH